MNKRLIALCIFSVMLTACSSGNAQPADTEISADNITVSEAEISSENVTESETESSENVTEGETESVPEASAEADTEAAETEEPETGSISQEKAFDNYRDAYMAKLAEIAEDENSNVPAFDLLDMDGDGVPELFASYADFHAAERSYSPIRTGNCCP